MSQAGKNRERLALLVYRLQTFTLPELVTKFRAEVGVDINIGGIQTVSEYVEDLRCIGALILEDGRYTTVMAR